MAYVPLTLKYRPRRMSDLVGQEVPVRTLRNMISRGQLQQSILCAGSRGVGKTTIARILALSLNCPNVDKVTQDPCVTCDMCREIIDESSMAVQEMDAASNGLVDDVRKIKEETRYSSSAKNKVYIIDECHSLSRAAWEAFLKMLEEPPPNVYFLFCTTELAKVPVTILSRSLSLPFGRIQVNAIVDRLRFIATTEAIDVDQDALVEIAKHANGGMRDAIKGLDQCWLFAGGEKVTKADVMSMIGSVNTSTLFDITRSLLESNLKNVYAILQDVYTTISDITVFVADLAAFYRDLMMCKTGLSPRDITPEYVASLRVMVEGVSLEYLIDSQTKLYQLMDHIRRSPLPARSLLEVYITQLLYSGITTTKTVAEPVKQHVEQASYVNPYQLAQIMGGTILQM